MTIPYDILTHDEARVQAARCLKCIMPYCHKAGCAVPELIPDLNNLICRGRWRDALALLETKNPFPEITGRICPALCEAACAGSIDGAAVPLRQIELTLAEQGFAEGWIVPQPPQTRTGRRVAIVGSGPAGLACAARLNKLGHTVAVFEKEKMPGGILWYGVPDFKLDKGLVRRRIDILQAEGVVFTTEAAVGADIPLQHVMNDYDAVVLAAGAEGPRDISVPGRELSGIHFAMDYLTQQNRLHNGEPVSRAELIHAQGKNVLVIGGGDTGVDCAETAVRQGASAIYQIELMPQPPAAAGRSARPGPQGQSAGRRWSMLTRKFTGENGILTGIEAVEVEWGQNPAGRITCTEKAGSAVLIPCELALIAAGFVSPGNDALIRESGAELHERGFVAVDEHNMAGRDGLFCAGDMTNGSTLVIKALDSGLKTAEHVARFLE